jgi:hypothetical protein
MKNKKLLQVAGFFITFLFLYLVFRNTDGKAVFSVLKTARLYGLLLVPLLSIALIVIKTFRWKLILDKNVSISYGTLLSVNMLSHMYNILLPFRSGEVLQVFLTKGSDAKASKASVFASLILNKFMELLSLLMIFFTLLLFKKLPIPEYILLPVKYLLIISICFLLCFAFGVINFKRIKAPSGKFFNAIYRFFLSLTYFEDKVLLIKSLLLSIVVWLIEAFMIFMLWEAMGLTLPFWTAILLLIGINLALLIPASSGGFGAYEYAIILVLARFGINKETALAFGLALHILEVLPVLLVGLIVYFRIKKG